MENTIVYDSSLQINDEIAYEYHIETTMLYIYLLGYVSLEVTKTAESVQTLRYESTINKKSGR